LNFTFLVFTYRNVGSKMAWVKKITLNKITKWTTFTSVKRVDRCAYLCDNFSMPLVSMKMTTITPHKTISIVVSTSNKLHGQFGF
jgi:hypothetical protein